MKKHATRFLCLLLACLTALGGTGVAQGEGAGEWDEQAYLALAQRLYGDGPPEAGMPTLIDALKHIGGLGGDYVITKGLDTIWGWIFGTDDSSERILAALDRIEGELANIGKQLNLLIYLLQEQNLENRLREKIKGMNDASSLLARAMDEFDHHSQTAEERYAALDIWFHYNPSGYANAFYFFANYCQRVSGKTAYPGEDAITLYDQIADLKWAFDESGAAYRQMQREMDIHFIMRMSAVLSLWLDKETRPGYTSEHSQKDLDMYRRMLKEGLTNVIDALEARPVVTTPGILTLHGHTGGARVSFEIVIGEPMPGQQAQTLDLRGTMRPCLTEGMDIAASEQGMRDLIATTLPAPLDDGATYRLIERAELELLAKEAEKRSTTAKALLLGGGFPGGEWQNVLYSSAERKNTPMKFSDQVQKMRNTNFNMPEEYSLRQLDIFTADLTAKSIWNPSVMGFGRVDDATQKILTVTYERGSESYASIFPIYSSRVQFAQNTGSFLPIWVRGSTVPSIPDPADEKPTPYNVAQEVTARIDGIEGSVLSAMPAGEGAGETIHLRIDGQTQLPEGVAERELPGKTARIAFEYREEEAEPYATRVTLVEPDGKSLGGTVVRIESAVEIIGGTEDLVVETGGTEYIFDLTGETRLDDGIAPGVTVHVAYHEADGGIRVADAVSVTGMRPVEPPETIEGSILRLERESMPGSQGALVLAIPGGEMRIAIPTGIPMDTLREAMLVRVTYRTQDGAHTAEQIEIVGNPFPDDGKRVVDGIVTRFDITLEIVGQAPLVAVAIPGGELELSVPFGLPDALDVGASVHAHYHVQGGVNIADDISVYSPPAPDPDDPFNPVPNPVDPVDPVDPEPPARAWVEGYVMRLDDPLTLAPGQQRELVISAAGQDYWLLVPAQMALAQDVQAGAFVHADYTPGPDGRGVVEVVYVLQPAPQPIDDPMPGPMDDPMPGPIVGPLG